MLSGSIRVLPDSGDSCRIIQFSVTAKTGKKPSPSFFYIRKPPPDGGGTGGVSEEGYLDYSQERKSVKSLYANYKMSFYKTLRVQILNKANQFALANP